ncbi:phosphate transport system permease protein PstA [Pseudodesulfovibrio sediminis]|uniref:Phosphate transport system permease protein PstA n=2 Tax=Pseudodesulfovibrio sediminis TaxID=2810563 RepID=A0ABM7P7L1_9BACT|nr:phosphate ABC transporter permease PstA [Pseudodesulfovibrio sediminis]BCS88873.1 phosphate transport system permease protein PstA [Pseudodesulfovibrio sediminis]
MSEMVSNEMVFSGSNIPDSPATRFRRKLTQELWFTLFRIAVAINALALIIIVGYMVYYGLPAISWDFLTGQPTEGGLAGGIFPCIVGTFYLSIGSMALALPLGVSAAIYLHEYAQPGLFMRIVRLCINNLAGVPSVVFGLFGMAFFVAARDLGGLGMGVSIAAGCMTLAVLILPVIIGTSEEALRSVPDTYREASLGLGATKWQTIFKVVLPSAMPGILTGCILSISRAAGETAAIMFTAAASYNPTLPSSIFDEVMALPYQIYSLSVSSTDPEATLPLQYGTSLVLVALVLGMNLVAILLRSHLRKKLSK